jgi:hypothetical protein
MAAADEHCSELVLSCRCTVLLCQHAVQQGSSALPMACLTKESSIHYHIGATPPAPAVRGQLQYFLEYSISLDLDLALDAAAPDDGSHKAWMDSLRHPVPP